MRRHSLRIVHLAGLFALAGAGSGHLVAFAPAHAQIYLSPNQGNTQRSRVSIDLGGGIRCSSDGGSVPSLSISAGAYPDQWGAANEVIVTPNATGNVGNRSSLLALMSVTLPLAKTNQNFDCTSLLKDAQIKARIENLRQLVDEDVISESQYRKALLKLFGPLSEELGGLVPAPSSGSTVVIPPSAGEVPIGPR